MVLHPVPQGRPQEVQEGSMLSFAFRSILLAAVVVFANAARADDPQYVVFHISGTFTSDRTAYVSGPIAYTGYKRCGEILPFLRKAKDSFSDYLQANYHGTFPLGENNNIASSYPGPELKSGQDLRDYANRYAADERQEGKNVVFTGFTYSCP